MVRRRKWVILQAAVLVPLAAILFSLGQERLFQASAEVLLSRQNLAASLTGIEDPALRQQAERYAETQAGLARVPEVAQRVLAAARVENRSPEQFLDASEVAAKPNADLLEFRVTDASQGLAVRLATEYARQFTIHRAELETAAVKLARGEVEAQLRELERSGGRESPLYASLVDKEQQLRTLEALQTGNAVLARAATEAEQVQPRPLRNGALGLALGLLLGIGLAFLWEALDTRIRSAEEIGERLGLPLLARLPEPPRHLRESNRIAMVAEPDEAHAEAFRMLRTNFEFVNQARRTRLVMVTSAHQGEGKSTTVANLAVALARSRWRVVLVDLDLRRPLLDRFFELEGRPGLTHVVLGHADLEEALVPVAVTEAGREVGTYAARDDDESAPASLDEVLTIRSGTRSARQAISPRMNGRGPAAVEGVLEVLPSGPIPPNPGEFVTVDALNGILESLRERSDLVLVDAPPLLHVGDALTLSAKVDALLLVTRMNVLRRPGLRELERILAGSPVPALGFIATGAQLDESYEYGYVAYSERASRRIEVEEELPV